MITYVALLRGIAPMNPNMSNDNLRKLFEELGFKDVKTVIASGNVIFKSGVKDSKKLEAMIEKALPEKLKFSSTTIVRSEAELQKLVKHDPFAGYEDTAKSKFNVTFLKENQKTELSFPYHNPDKTYELIGMFDRAIFSWVNTTSAKTPDVMIFLEKQFGKQITTRTWKTVHKIIAKMQS